MHMTGLARFTGRLAGRLSGGMKQKLGLACTLVRPPQLLLLSFQKLMLRPQLKLHPLRPLRLTLMPPR